ncbi:MAG: hypothetical protein A2W11_01300 [Ignavibacteria bacterium RBG_16_35_7]|nr:MAG: hypothetical protein A2W11_01300 [Ignavibacteria bacterium RBG_16_35_7]
MKIKLKEKKMKTKILIISVLLGFPVMAQSSLSTDNSNGKIIEVNLDQRKDLVQTNLSCTVDNIEIVDDPPYIIFNEDENKGFCFKKCEKKNSL